MDSYSSFFSSGLLAPQRDLTATMYQCPPSPATTESCMDDSDAEMESVPTLSNLHAHEKKLTLNTNPPRLRKRKSSTTLASSPMSAIRSPMRAANVALQVQRHIPDTPSRSRSGSLSAANSIASQSTSLMGRLRSNSTGEVLRTRRRRNIPGPALPMPALPLPELPPSNSVFSTKLSRSRAGSYNGKMATLPNSTEGRIPFAESQNGVFGYNACSPMPSFNEADEMKEN